MFLIDYKFEGEGKGSSEKAEFDKIATLALSLYAAVCSASRHATMNGALGNGKSRNLREAESGLFRSSENGWDIPKVGRRFNPISGFQTTFRSDGQTMGLIVVVIVVIIVPVAVVFAMMFVFVFLFVVCIAVVRIAVVVTVAVVVAL